VKIDEELMEIWLDEVCDINGIMYKERKVYIPKNNKLRAEIIRLYHNTLVGGHRGQ